MERARQPKPEYKPKVSLPPERVEEEISAQGSFEHVTLSSRDGSNCSSADVLFKILPVMLKGPTGIEVNTFAMLVEGSSITLLDQTLADELKLNGTPKPLCLRWTDKTLKHEPDSFAVSLIISGENTAKEYSIKNVRNVSNLTLQSQTVRPAQLSKRFPYLAAAKMPEIVKAVS